MKKRIGAPLKIIALILALFALVCCFWHNLSANAAPVPRNENYISAYKVNYDLREDRSMTVTTDITAEFYDPVYHSGIYMYIPLGAGELVRNLTVSEIKNGTPDGVVFNVDEGYEFLLVDIGDEYSKYRETHTYRITYDYCLTKITQNEENKFALTPVGSGWECVIQNIEITMLLPEGYISGSAICFENSADGKVADLPVAETLRDGRVCLTANYGYMNTGWEIRFDMDFEQGALTAYGEFTPWIFVIAVIVIFCVAATVKFAFFKKPVYTPVVNFDAPDSMDPLYMGKLIDGKVDDEDITSIIFYWADKGYVKINLDDKDDPAVIRVRQRLPEESPSYEKLMYEKLFGASDVFKPSEVSGTFYATVAKVKAMVNAKARNIYDKTSITACSVIGVICALVCAAAPVIIAITMISANYLPLFAAFAALPSLLITYAVSAFTQYYELKNKKKGLLLSAAVTAGATIITLLFSAFGIPDAICAMPVKIVLATANCATQLVAATIPRRSKDYVNRLNGILGFKNFILLAEKDRLEKMLEDDPQFYYRVLPYAQVLGVSDKWEEKFEDITVQPPQWATGSVLDTMIDIYITRAIIRSASAGFKSHMIAPPKSSGQSGGFNFRSGGGFGGFSGGGHGGGGGGFR